MKTPPWASLCPQTGKPMRNLLGYLLGLCLFVLGIPALMWAFSDRGFPYVPENVLQLVVAVFLVVLGLALSIWSIVYMRRVGKGNPFDAYGHEVAPRTKHLMTEGPYGICRNPMLLGVYILDAGVMLYLWDFWPLAVFAVEVYLLTRQVRSEEKRLEKDFGEEYLAYKERTRRYLPSIPLPKRGKAWLRLYSIYCELGYNPWRKPRKERKKGKGVYMGAKEAIPFMNDDGKRTFSQLVMRPGYLMRDYIQRGQFNRYVAPLTALLVFYSVMTLLLSVVQPEALKDSFSDALLHGFKNATVLADSTERDSRSGQIMDSIFDTMRESILITRLDLYPEAADTPWKKSLAAVEGDIRSKGIPLFLGTFLLMWLSMVILLKKYRISASGAAAASAYVLCQFCIFMFLALLLSFGKSIDLSVLLTGILLFIDYRQWLGIGNRDAFWLTVKTGLLIALFRILFYLLVGGGMVLYAIYRVG